MQLKGKIRNRHRLTSESGSPSLTPRGKPERNIVMNVSETRLKT